MKRESFEFLENYLEIYEHDGIDAVFEFFKYYSAFEVSSIEGLNMAVVEFCEYLRRNVSRIKRKGTFSESSVIKTLDSFKRSITVSIDRYTNESYKNFATLAYEVSPNKRKESVLEVGAGRIPTSSIWLAKDIDKVATIDSEFYLSNIALKNMGVDAREAYFNACSSVDGYSLVIGRCPCSAIKHMVKKCSEANIPYLIKLCDCDIIGQWYIDGLSTWRNILPEYDKNVKLYKDYAYNLDISEEQLKGLIEKYDSNPPLRARRPVRIVRYYNKGELVKEEEELVN